MVRPFAIAAAVVIALATVVPSATYAFADVQDHSGSLASDKTSSARRASSDLEIACWGDSLTEGRGASDALIIRKGCLFDAGGMSYPDVLERLTGLKTYNYGVSGATSEEIGIMQGGLEPLYDLDTYLVLDESIMAQGQAHPGDILILEMGSNGGWSGDYETLIAQYRAMIEHAGCDKYIVIGDTDDPSRSIDRFANYGMQYYSGESIWDYDGTSENGGIGLGSNGEYAENSWNGGSDATKPSSETIAETPWETALREAFGKHFVNMRAFLVERGLDTAGLTETAASAEGCVSRQLRADWTHLNSYGYYAQAVGVYEKGVELGYWPFRMSNTLSSWLDAKKPY